MPPSSGRRCTTPEQDAAIVAAYDAGEVVTAIAHRHGVSEALVLDRAREAGRPPRRAGGAQAGRPVYAEDGSRFAWSVSTAARRLGCVPSNLHLNHLEAYADGYRLVSRPRAARPCEELCTPTTTP